MLYLSVPAASSSDRHLLTYRLSALSLKTPCYGVFVCAVRTAYGLTRSPSNPLICHFAGIIKKNGYPLCISVLSEMVEISGFEPLTS